MSDTSQLEYAIRRLNWRRTHYGIVRMPGAVTIGALPTPEEAEADRARREAEVRARVGNPFICGPTHSARSRLPEVIFLDWLRDAGIEPLQAGQKRPVNWFGWWEQAKVRFTPGQIAHVWNGLDRVRFFEVVTRREDSVGYAVVRVDWEHNDTWWEAGTEGGTPIKVFRKWTTAEEHRRTLEELQQRENAPGPPDTPGDWLENYDITRWANEPHWPVSPPPPGGHYYQNATFTHGGSAPYFEIVEVELSDLRAGNRDE